MSRHAASDHDPDTALAPLLDLIFILLILFLLTTSFMAADGPVTERAAADPPTPHHAAENKGD